MVVQESDVLVPSQVDRVAIKEQLVPVMISLSTPQLARLQAQVSYSYRSEAETSSTASDQLVTFH